MTRAKARNSNSFLVSFVRTRDLCNHFQTDPDQFEIIPFKAKALKILLHDAQSSNVVTSKTMDPDAESDDGVSFYPFVAIHERCRLRLSYVYRMMNGLMMEPNSLTLIRTSIIYRVSSLSRFHFQ